MVDVYPENVLLQCGNAIHLGKTDKDCMPIEKESLPKSLGQENQNCNSMGSNLEKNHTEPGYECPAANEAVRAEKSNLVAHEEKRAKKRKVMAKLRSKMNEKKKCEVRRKDRENKRQKLQNKVKEREYQTKSRHKLTDEKKAEKRLKNKEHMAKRRQNDEFRQKENIKVAGSKTKVCKQKIKRRRKDQIRKKLISLVETKKLFDSYLSFGPEFVCTCCCGLFYKHSVSMVPKKEKLIEQWKSDKQKKSIPHNVKIGLIEKVCRGVKSVRDTEWICSTCYKHLKNCTLPELAFENGLQFPEIPIPLKGLTQLEERCISPRIPFMQIRELGVDHQFGIKGNVVNVK